jgi:hypothetical protein
VADGPVLTKHAPQIASAKENSARSVFARKAGLLPRMKGNTRQSDVVGHLTKSGFPIARNGASARTLVADFHSHISSPFCLFPFHYNIFFAKCKSKRAKRSYFLVIFEEKSQEICLQEVKSVLK